MGDCCLNILIFIDGVEYNLSTFRQVNLSSEFVRYTFRNPYDIENNSVVAYLEFDDVLNTWVIIDPALGGTTLFVAGENVPVDCPVSSSEDWSFEPEEGEEFSFVIYEVSCVRGIGDNDVPNLYPEEEEPYEVYCENLNLIKKQKMKLSKDIAAISKREVFGLDCGGEWENLFMRSLIIDALSCPPYGVISKDTERCLIGKLNEKCNC
jgi:hypothetical protein